MSTELFFKTEINHIFYEYNLVENIWQDINLAVHQYLHFLLYDSVVEVRYKYSKEAQK